MNHLSELVAFLPIGIILFVLSYIISQCRRVTNDVANNANKIGSEQENRALIVNKALFNFYMVVGLSMTIISGYLKLFGTELFIGLFVALLAGLGVKLGFDLKG